MEAQNKKFLQHAIRKSEESLKQGGFPAGALIVKNNQIIGEGVSLGKKLHDPTSHAEIAAMREACKSLQSPDLSGATLYVSLEPCLMCLAASAWSSISKIIYACSREKLPSDYYEGHHLISRINADITRPIELQYFPEFENEALAIIENWQKSQSK